MAKKSNAFESSVRRALKTFFMSTALFLFTSCRLLLSVSFFCHFRWLNIISMLFHASIQFFYCIQFEIIFHFITYNLKCCQFSRWRRSPKWCVFRDKVFKIRSSWMVSAFCSNQVIEVEIESKESQSHVLFKDYLVIITTYQLMSIDIYWFLLYRVNWSKHPLK